MLLVQFKYYSGFRKKEILGETLAYTAQCILQTCPQLSLILLTSNKAFLRAGEEVSSCKI